MEKTSIMSYAKIVLNHLKKCSNTKMLETFLTQGKKISTENKNLIQNCQRNINEGNVDQK